jgi:hypothetical protein
MTKGFAALSPISTQRSTMVAISDSDLEPQAPSPPGQKVCLIRCSIRLPTLRLERFGGGLPDRLPPEPGVRRFCQQMLYG